MNLKSMIALLFVLSQSAALLPAQVSAPIPAMTFCQQSLPCITVHFKNGQGEARLSDGSIAQLTVESYDGQTIHMKRVDSAGTFAGLQGEYGGSLDTNFYFKGKLTWDWPGHGGLSSGSIDWEGTPWATAEPVTVPGPVAQKLETQFQWGKSAGMLNAFHASGTADGEVIITPQGNVAEVKDTHHAPAFCTLDSLAATWAWHFHPYMRLFQN